MAFMVLRALITGYVWLVLLITLLPFFLLYLMIGLVTLPFDRRLLACHYFVSLWAVFYLIINPWWKVIIRHRERLDRRKVYIIMCNHQSVLDALVLYRLFFPFRWVSKKELFSVPVVGWVLYLNKHIPVVRGDKLSAAIMIDRAARSLSEGISVLIFPEGTRSHDGNIMPFREGAFKLALHARQPLLPVIIDGAWQALPKTGFLFRKRQSIIVRILPAVNPEDYQHMDIDQLPGYMERYMADELKKLRNENNLLLS
jgi:1-acyl-sn-glycerol-3-phosphate acyltransferase